MNVFDLNYMKVIRFSLNCIGLWPNAELGSTKTFSKLIYTWNCILIVTSAGCVVTETMYVVQKFNILPFIDLGHTYINVFMTCIFMQRLFQIWTSKFRAVLEEFVLKFHLMHHKHTSDFSEKMYIRVNKICTIASIVIHYQMYVGLSLYNLVPFYSNYNSGMFSSNRPENGTFEHAMYYVLPFDQYTDVRYYTLICLFNWVMSYVVSVSFCCFDLILCLIVFHIWGHLNVFEYEVDYVSISRLERDARGPTTLASENEIMFQQLRDIIIHHKMIKKFLGDTSEAYSISLCVYLAFHQITGCILLLECSSLDAKALSRYGLLTLIIFQQLIQLSVIFELIGSKGDALVNIVYYLPWEHMDARNRKLVQFLLWNVQTPIALKAGNIVPVGVETMASVIRRSCSYFVMLTTVGKE